MSEFAVASGKRSWRSGRDSPGKLHGARRRRMHNAPAAPPLRRDNARQAPGVGNIGKDNSASESTAPALDDQHVEHLTPEIGAAAVAAYHHSVVNLEAVPLFARHRT